MHLDFKAVHGHMWITIDGEEDAKPEEFMVSFKNMHQQIIKMFAENQYNVIFDLSKIHYINSSLISLFVIATTKARLMHRWVKLIVPNKNSKEILELVGLNKIAQMYNDEASFRKDPSVCI